MDVYAIHHVTVNVTDLARSRAFYEELMGLKPVPRPRSFNFEGAWYQLGPAQLHLVVRPEADPAGSHHFAIQVLDTAAARQRAEEADLKIQDAGDIPGIARFFVRDPDANLIEVVGPREPWFS